ncbi:MAG: T9SS type A sorting domain-containing protein [Bacteroidetes bacterium]|nr:T9SS type A sorting domain-containing protein [Bacteroidota bacterium]
MRYNLSLLFLLFCITTSAQTFKRYDLINGSNSSFPFDYMVLGDRMIFFASDTPGGEALWVTDGRDSTTLILKPLNHINYAQEFDLPFAATIGDKAFFLASEDRANMELWVSDGSYNGTNRIKKIDNSSYISSAANNIILCNSKLLFLVGNDNSQTELWVSDQTESGTKLLKTFNANPSTISQINLLNRKAYFRLRDSSSWQLWSTDGSTGGTQLIYRQNLPINFQQGIPPLLTPVNNELFFTGIDSAHGTELWVTNGTTFGTHIVKDLNPGPSSGMVLFHFPFNGKALFVGYDGNNSGLYSSDGTQTGTGLISVIVPAPYWPPVLCNGRLYYYGYNGQHQSLAVTDGTTAGTYLLKDRNGNFLPQGTVATYNNRVYLETDFSMSAIAHGLYQSDGTDTGTYLILPGKMLASQTVTTNYGFCQFKGSLWLGGIFDNTGMELWRITTTPATSISSVDQNYSFSIYPNPNHGNFTIKTDIHTGIVTVYDITGRIILSADVKGNITDLQLPAGAKGIYFIKLQSGDAISTNKILVE